MKYSIQIFVDLHKLYVDFLVLQYIRCVFKITSLIDPQNWRVSQAIYNICIVVVSDMQYKSCLRHKFVHPDTTFEPKLAGHDLLGLIASSKNVRFFCFDRT